MTDKKTNREIQNPAQCIMQIYKSHFDFASENSDKVKFATKVENTLRFGLDA